MTRSMRQVSLSPLVADTKQRLESLALDSNNAEVLLKGQQMRNPS